MILLRRMCLLAIVCLLTAAPTCRIGPPPPPPGALNVPFYQQQDWAASPPKLCGATTVQMWQSYVTHGVYATQPTIWSWMESNYPGQTSAYGASPDAILGAARQYVGWPPISLDYYAGIEEKKQSVADITKNLNQNNPTIALVEQGFHAVIVVGAQWRTLQPNGNPSLDALYLHDPLGGRFVSATIGGWLQYMGNFCGDNNCTASIQRSNSRFFAAPERSEFDWMGGVYYGPPPPGATGRYKINGEGSCYWDQNDSGPNQCTPAGTGRYKVDGQGGCYWDPNDSGPDQCSPNGARRNVSPRLLWQWARRLVAPRAVLSARTGLGRTDAPHANGSPARYSTGAVPQIGGVTPSSIPHRWATKKQDILENFLAGMSVTGIDGHERFKAIKDSSGWTVQQVLPVSRLDGRRGYYLIDIVGREGLPLMTASVDAEGWLVAVVDTSGHTSRRPTQLDVASAAVSHRAGVAAVRAARHVSGLSTVEPGLPEFAPLARVERVDGIYYVNSAGDVFRQTTDEPSLQRSRPAISVQGRLKRLERIE